MNPQAVVISPDQLRSVADQLEVKGVADLVTHGDVIIPLVKAAEPTEFFLYRNPQGLWWSTENGGEWGGIGKARIYTKDGMGSGGEWVKFTEIPF